MIDPVEVALAHLRGQSPHGVADISVPVTINFHPDITIGDETLINILVAQGIYRSQFETGISNGGLTAFRGGDRWNWESRIFGSAYDEEPPSVRSKYGALNYRRESVGGSRRFGSCHLRMAPHLRCRTSFCYPDSHWQPRDFAVDHVGPLIALAEANRFNLDACLDNYIEAHIHGPLNIREDVEAVVLDPSFRGTSVEESARLLGCKVEWHEGFRLSLDSLGDCVSFRGLEAANGITSIAEDMIVTPAILGCARNRKLDYQTSKWAWHCIARFGHS